MFTTTMIIAMQWSMIQEVLKKYAQISSGNNAPANGLLVPVVPFTNMV